MKFLHHFIKNARSIILISAVAGIASGLVSACVFGFITRSLAVQPRTGGETYLGLCVLSLFVTAASSVIINHVSFRAIADLRIALCKKVLDIYLAKLEDIGSHRILVLLTEHVGTLTQAFTNVPGAITNFTILVICIGYLIIVSWISALWVLASLFVGVLIFQLGFVRSGMRYVHRTHKEQDKLFLHFKGLNEGIKELKMNRARREDFVLHLLENSESNVYQLRMKSGSIFAVGNSFATVLLFGVIGLLLYFLPARVGLDHRTVVLSVMILIFLSGPLGGLVGAMPLFARAKGVFKELRELGIVLESAANDAVTPSNRQWDLLPKQIQLRQVQHSYATDGRSKQFTLGPVDLVLNSGELVFVVGGNGSGKTTLAKLLAGLYIPEAGTLELDGRVVSANDIEIYREQFAVVFSDSYVFDALLGLRAPCFDARAKRILVDLQLDDIVTINEGKLSTTELSQGQKKRLALLVALLEDRPFYIFDEWAAYQDPSFRRTFYTRILPELKARGKGVLTITHDNTYLSCADRVIELDYGRIVRESGAVISEGEIQRKESYGRISGQLQLQGGN